MLNHLNFQVSDYFSFFVTGGHDRLHDGLVYEPIGAYWNQGRRRKFSAGPVFEDEDHATFKFNQDGDDELSFDYQI